MDSNDGGQDSKALRQKAAAEIARKKVLAAYKSGLFEQSNASSKSDRNLGIAIKRTLEKDDPLPPNSYKNTPINAATVSKNNAEEWKKYHSAWQNYYQKYYSEYYSKAAKSYIENEQKKAAESERIKAEGEKPTKNK